MHAVKELTTGNRHVACLSGGYLDSGLLEVINERGGRASGIDNHGLDAVSTYELDHAGEDPAGTGLILDSLNVDALFAVLADLAGHDDGGDATVR